MRDSDPDSKPMWRREEKDRELQGVIMRSPGEVKSADMSAAEQVYLPKLCVDDDKSQCLGLTGGNTYRLVGIISHNGTATHSGHYVSDMYSVDRDRWFHYDDRTVTVPCVDESDVLVNGPHRNGYIFLYLHKDLCSQVAWTPRLPAERSE